MTGYTRRVRDAKNVDLPQSRLVTKPEKLTTEERDWRNHTVPLKYGRDGEPLRILTDPHKQGMGNGGSSLTSNWCLWCPFVEDDKTPLELHMNDHVATGFTPAVPLNHFLKWLGLPEIPKAGWVMITIQTYKDRS